MTFSSAAGLRLTGVEAAAPGHGPARASGGMSNGWAEKEKKRQGMKGYFQGDEIEEKKRGTKKGLD